ncbi:TonB-linked SusC/RagA family outer membrane protein [Pedobacter africanus]|uniref:TonB-linked SusC/RagA family outer membrane protein n=1 Tax=Pedobacter africanus TaxID=151894 RepID=A0ACC6KTQ8_9SPHI|nr:SusC/RagA family TonB-linked outer membrane protein [Pedobacter africanus]MDR6782740.1 TonB-linked SusC/RagA family outer membrane protein [Pedobacter africanus]
MKINGKFGGYPFWGIPPKILRIMTSNPFFWVRSHYTLKQFLRAMKLTAIVMLVFLVQVSALTKAQITLNEKGTSLQKVLEKISKQTGYDLVYSNLDFKHTKPVTLTLSNVSIDAALQAAFKEQPVMYQVSGKTLMIKKKDEPSFLERIVDRFAAIDVRGRVVDEAKNPLPGATVKVKGKNQMTKTNSNGEFRLADVEENSVLEISYVGYRTREVKAAAQLGTLIMEIGNSQLDELSVVSTGYQGLPKERATGSFSKVDNDTFNRQISTDVISRLKGIAPSIFFDERSVNPKLTIRGQATIFGNDQPLIVVDNFPYEGDIRNINPNDIEDIDILKDAAAASIWGVRAGNGVIVIKTKKGKANQPMNISITANNTFGERPDLWYVSRMKPTDLIDIEKMLFEKGAYNTIISNTTVNRPYSPVIEILNDQKNNRITANEAKTRIDALRNYDLRKDMHDYLYQTSLNQQYAVNLSGGSEKYTYYFSSGFDKNRGAEIGNSLSRISLNSNQVFKPLKNLEISAGLAYNQNTQTTTNVVSMLNNMGQEKMYPYARLVDDNGNPAVVTKDHSTVLKQKALTEGLLNWDFLPLKELALQDNKYRQSEMRLNTAVKYAILPQLSAEARFQYENQLGRRRNFYDQESYAMRDQINKYTTFTNGVMTRNIPLGGRLDNTNTELNALNGRFQLNYDQKWNKHQVNAIGGFEVRETKSSGISSRQYGFDPNVGSSMLVDYLTRFTQYGKGGSATISNSDSYSGTVDRIRSYYMNGAYNYDLRYVISASARIDQSNLFGAQTNQKSVPLWSVGMKWNVNKEEFYKLDWLPELSLRSTYGYSGNIDRTTTAYTTARLSRNSNNSLPNADLVTPPNKELRWERNAMWNIGLDFGFKHNRLIGSIEYFNRTGTDLIGNGEIDPTTGFTSYRGNVANMKGRGIDLEINSINIRSKSFNWQTSAIFSYAKDEITKYQRIATISSFISVNDFSIGRTPSGYAPVVGRPLFSVYSYPWAGLDPNTGQPRGYLNGDPSSQYSQITSYLSQDPANNLIFNGNALAPYFGALRNTFDYKGIELSFNITYRFGYYFRSNTIMYSALYTYFDHGDFYRRWQKPGDELITNVPAMRYPADLQADDYYRFSEAMISKGDHIRLQDLTLAYNFRGVALQKLKIKNLKLFAYANNLGILWRANKVNMDPDFPTMKPARTLAFGINCGF